GGRDSANPAHARLLYSDDRRVRCAAGRAAGLAARLRGRIAAARGPLANPVSDPARRRRALARLHAGPARSPPAPGNRARRDPAAAALFVRVPHEPEGPAPQLTT